MNPPSNFTANVWASGILPEIYAAQSALATGDRLLRADVPLERDLSGILAVYSIGVERLLKLALGMCEIALGHPWPTMNSTRNGWGHAIASMDERLREKLRALIDSGEFEHADMLRSWLCTLEHDLIWHAVVVTLEAYADKGRYHHLDTVAGGTVASPNPTQLWDDVEKAAIAMRPALAAQYAGVLNGDPWEPFELALTTEVANSILRWEAIITAAGMHGVYGADGKTLGSAGLPEGALPIQVEAACV